jgi:transketolase
MAAPDGTGRPLEAVAEELLELGTADPGLLVVEGNPARPNPTRLFQRRYPERAFDLGAMEPAMVTLAAGLALEGRAVVASSLAVALAGRSYAELRQSVCYNRANVKLLATRAGLQAGGDGGTVQIVEDVGLMRGLPGMTVVAPADAPSSRAALRAIAALDGPAYLRLPGELAPTIGGAPFRLGEARELRPGADLTLVAFGAMLPRALAVAEELHHVGVEARVLDFASIKPFDEKALVKAARETGAILTLEEHTVLTGLGGLVAATTSENYPVPVRRLGVPDLFGESGEPSELLDRYGLSVERGLEEAWELLKARGKVP